MQIVYDNVVYWVYLLKSKTNHSLYIGRTDNLQRRLTEHNRGKSHSTKPGIPWKIIYLEGYLSIDDAAKREHNLKYFGRALGQLKRRIDKSLQGD